MAKKTEGGEEMIKNIIRSLTNNPDKIPVVGLFIGTFIAILLSLILGDYEEGSSLVAIAVIATQLSGFFIGMFVRNNIETGS